MRYYENTDGFFISVHKKTDVDWIDEAEKAIYLAKTKTWFIPKTTNNHKLLQEKGLVLQVTEVSYREIPKETKDKLPSKLYDVQKEALQFMYNVKGNGIMSLDMGLGKTATSLCYTLLEDINCTLVLCPASLKLQWEKEINNWLNEYDVCIISGRKPIKITPHKFIIINYEIFKDHVENLSKLPIDLVIVDEVQFFQNLKASRTKALLKLSSKAKRIMALSGTPITRRPVQFYPILHILRPDKFTTFFHYTKKYCNAHIEGGVWDFDGVSNTNEFREILKTIMIRKTKADSIDIPDKIIIPILLEQSEKARTTYKDEEQNLMKEVFGETKTTNDSKSFNYLQYLAYMGKREAMLDWIDNTIQDHKLVVFANHRKIVDDIYEYFKNDAVRYYGGMSQEQKTKAKEDFLNNKKLFIGNIISAGTGLDGLQKECNNVAFVELPWTAAQFDQATDRLWRGGQKNNVNVYVLMAKDSVEERIMAVLDKSREIVESIIDGKEAKEINLLSEVMKSYKKS